LEANLKTREASFRELNDRYKIDLSYIQNQDQLLLNSASSNLGRKYDSIADLRTFFSTAPHVAQSQNPPLNSEKLKVSYQNLKRKYRRMKSDFDSEISKLRAFYDSEIAQLTATICEQREKIHYLDRDHRTKIHRLESQIPQRKRLFRYTAPSITISGSIVKPAHHQKIHRKVDPELQIVDQLAHNIDSLTAENQRLRSSLEEERQKVHSSEGHVFKLKHEVNSAEDKIRQSASDLQSAESKYGKLIRASRSKIVDQRETIKKLRDDIQKLNSEIVDAKRREAEHNLQIARLQTHIELLPSPEPTSLRPPPVFEPYFDIASAIPPELQPHLRKILDNPSLPLATRCDLSIRKLGSLWSELYDQLQMMKTQNSDVRKFTEEVTSIIMGKPISLDTIAADFELRNEILRRLARVSNPSEEHRFRRKIRRLQDELHAVSRALNESETAVEQRQTQLDSLQEKTHQIGNSQQREPASSVAGYKELVRQLRRKCHEQRKTLQALNE
jgi:chromosome segregation ATPase